MTSRSCPTPSPMSESLLLSPRASRRITVTVVAPIPHVSRLLNNLALVLLIKNQPWGNNGGGGRGGGLKMSKGVTAIMVNVRGIYN
ncbi:hypothetical protein SESBI_05609 [Sesbania bispinosa]|nr:hypothetical protein SESBI_05609 [Sesbania bispinosa]